MRKLLSETEIEKAFNEYELDINWPNAFKDHRSSAFDAFKAAFTLLMPIIEKQMEALEDVYIENLDLSGFNRYELIATLEGDDEIVKEAIEETKQMLEKLGEVK